MTQAVLVIQALAYAQIVVLSQVLACKATLGYEDLYNLRVHKFNGTAVCSLAHLAQLATACADKYMRFDLDHSVRAHPQCACWSIACSPGESNHIHSCKLRSQDDSDHLPHRAGASFDANLMLAD